MSPHPFHHSGSPAASPQKPRARAAPTQSPKKPVAVDLWGGFAAHATLCNQKLRGVHEGAGGKFTPSEREGFADKGQDYGGITGTVSPASLGRIADVYLGREADGQRLTDAAYRLNETSVFCDVGCGTGRPSFYFAGLPIRASIGFDVEPLQVRNSLAGWRHLRNQGVKFRASLALFHANALELDSIEPVTHVHGFVGYSQFTQLVARLAARSATVKVLSLIILHKKDLVESGVLDAGGADTDAIALPGMQMPGGYSYLGIVVPMTDARRRRILHATRHLTSKPGAQPDLSAVVGKCLEKDGDEVLDYFTAEFDEEHDKRPKRARKTVDYKA
jgi:hypothetical protein